MTAPEVATVVGIVANCMTREKLREETNARIV